MSPEVPHAARRAAPLAFAETRLASAGFLVVCAIAFAVGAVGIRNEGYVMPGDIPRYLMDGVYFRDLFADHPFGGWRQWFEYTQLYYARYPALSLGHHPVLLPLLEAPLFALFGISVGVGRLVPLASLVVAVALLYTLVKGWYGPLAAFFAAALLTTSPYVALMSQSVLAEMPAVALMLAAAVCLDQFCRTERRGMLAGFAVSFVLALYAKQLTILAVPAFVVGAVASLGLRRVLRRDVVVAAAAIVICALPLVPLSIRLSPTSVAGAIQSVEFESRAGFFVLLGSALERQFAWLTVVLAVFAAGRAVVVRDRRGLLLLTAGAAVLPALFLFKGVVDETARYTIYWVPVVSALAASLAATQSRAGRTLFAAALLAATARQMVEVHRTQLVGAEGYEEAAEFVLSSNPGPTVLFSGDIDTGFFSFFVRKHDAARRLVVLRSDKLFTTSYMARVDYEDRIHDADEIYPLLHKFGVRYVVVEDRPSGSRVLEALRRELHTPRFAERRRIPIGTTHAKLRGTSLAVYELLDATPPDRDAVLSLNLPIVRRSLSVPLTDLLSRKYLR